MNAVDFQQVQSIFAEVLRLRPVERPAAIERLCGNDAALRAEIESLLAADRAAGALLEENFIASGIRSAIEDVVTGPRDDAPDLDIGVRVGPFVIERLIAEGGFGRVYLAQQAEPIRRRVAMKVIKRGMDSREVLARFQLERHALGQMDHPGIAKILDAGLTHDHRPYLAMEFIDGEPLTQYCDRLSLGITARLRLFLDICHAVQHAHQKGIIHRDLKPSNILVSEAEGRSHVRIIDFGVAKVLEGPLAERSLRTLEGQFLGTPAYMSPEQARGGAHAADTRSDIYALGAILYELLSGEPPFDADRLRGASMMEVQRIIVSEDPPRASVRVFGSAGAPRNATAAARAESTVSLARRLRGDLDTILAKALEKDRGRRYQSVSELAEDIERHLSNRTISAHRPTLAYQLRKFSQRNKSFVIAGVIVLAVVLTSIGALSVFAYRESIARRSAVAEGARAEEQARLAAAEGANAQRQSTIAESVSKFFVDDLLAEAAPEHTRGKVLTINEVLDRAIAKLDQPKEPLHPEAEARVRRAVGITLCRLGRPADAERHLHRSLDLWKSTIGEENDPAMETINWIAISLLDRNKQAEAEPILRRLVELRTKVQGPEHRDTLGAMCNLGNAYLGLNQPERALPLHLRCMEVAERTLPKSDSYALNFVAAVARGLNLSGRPIEALPYYELSVERSTRAMGRDHPETLGKLHNLADLLKNIGCLDEAIAMGEDVLSLRIKVQGLTNAQTTSTINNLANTLVAARRYTEAIAYAEVGADIRRITLGDTDTRTLNTLSVLGDALRGAGRHAEAEPLLLEVAMQREHSLGQTHKSVLSSWLDDAECLLALGRAEEARAIALSVKGRSESLSPPQPEIMKRAAEILRGTPSGE